MNPVKLATKALSEKIFSKSAGNTSSNLTSEAPEDHSKNLIRAAKEREVFAIREELFQAIGPRWFENTANGNIEPKGVYVVFDSKNKHWVLVRIHQDGLRAKIIGVSLSGGVVPARALGFTSDFRHYRLSLNGDFAPIYETAHIEFHFDHVAIGLGYRKNLVEALLIQRYQQTEPRGVREELGQSIFRSMAITESQKEESELEKIKEEDYLSLIDPQTDTSKQILRLRRSWRIQQLQQQLLLKFCSKETPFESNSQLFIRFDKTQNRWLVLKKSKNGTKAKVISTIHFAGAVVTGAQLGLQGDQSKARFKLLANGGLVLTKRRPHLGSSSFSKSRGYSEAILNHRIRLPVEQIKETESRLESANRTA